MANGTIQDKSESAARIASTTRSFVTILLGACSEGVTVS